MASTKVAGQPHHGAGPHNPNDVLLSAPWRRGLLVALPFAALAFLFGLIFDELSGQTNAFDRVAYPVLTLSLLALEGVLCYSKRSLRLVVFLIVAGAGTFFISKLAYLLFFAPPHVHIQAEMTETFFWIPAVYLLSFLIPNLKGGRLSSVLFSVLTSSSACCTSYPRL